MLRSLLLGLAVSTLCGCALTPQELGQKVCQNIILPEQRSIDVRHPDQLPPARIPNTVPPRTVARPQPGTGEWQLSLDEAIRIALENAEVIRVLVGTTVTASGQTIYDAAVTNTTIDQAQARFDPVLTDSPVWSRTNTPVAELNPLDFTQSLITSTPTDTFQNTFGLNKTNVLGGQWALTWTDNVSRFHGSSLLSSSFFTPTTTSVPTTTTGVPTTTTSIPTTTTSLPISLFPLNPQITNTVLLSYTQPLLQGAGYHVNMAPIVIARINTEQAFFQYKDSVQEMVRGVIEGYWNLVQARTDVWARKIQVQQSKEAYDREQARLKAGLGDAATVAQTRVTYNQFRANQIAAEANVLIREDALRNILGLSPTDCRSIVPVSAPTSQRLEPDWDAVLRLAELRRPDIINLKLIIEADKQRLLQAENQALPQLNAVVTYQFNGLSGAMPNGEELETEPGQFTNWSAGLNLSLPLGLRQGRAMVRQQRLTLARDEGNVDQGLHAAAHDLANTIRNLDSAYEQYLAFKETREAADLNVRVQSEQFKAGRTIYLNVLQALNDWGTAVSSEAQQLLNYNIALATLERQTGTILETHGLVFAEEQFPATGPLMLPCLKRLYPLALPPTGAPHRYPSSGEPSEEAFDLKNPATRDTKPREKLPGEKDN
jgi:outer membrane protein TolC